jgi:hypothetical protein
MPETSVNEIRALWVHAENEQLELLADSHEREGAWLLEWDDPVGDDDPPPTAPARPALVLWELEDLEEAA